MISLSTYPMHGQQKLIREGYRTRDGHMIEWFGKILSGRGSVEVVSRPEPAVLSLTVERYNASHCVANTFPVDTNVWRVPDLRDRKKWWVKSADYYPYKNRQNVDVPAVIWNPLFGVSKAFQSMAGSNNKIVVDLLDDWTLHHHFGSIRAHVDRGYKTLFDRADFVTANSEGTVSLAERYGRTDVKLVPNGCDPHRFSSKSLASGPVKIGYVGKIGKRVDVDLVSTVAAALPECEFIFAGPVLDKEVGLILSGVSNLKMLGDVHYSDVPHLLQTFDIGWVPHNVGQYEVGGDVIKTYEYRAAHLPVVTTPLIGAGHRGLDGVDVVDRSSQSSWFRERVRGVSRVPRQPTVIPRIHTWEHKAISLLKMAGLMPSESGGELR